MRKILFATVAFTAFAFYGTAMADSNGNAGDDNDSIDVGDVDVDLSEDNRTDYIEVDDVDVDASTNLETGDIEVDASQDNRTDYIEVDDVTFDNSTNIETGDIEVDTSTNIETDDITVNTGDDTRHDYIETGDIDVEFDASQEYEITFDSYNDVTQTVGNATSTVDGNTVAVAAYVPINVAAGATNDLTNIRSIEAMAVGSNVANSVSIGGISVNNR